MAVVRPCVQMQAPPPGGVFLWLRGDQMELILNGKKVDLPGVETVYDVLKHYGLEGKIVMVELNEAIVAKDDYARTPLRPNDKLEIVHFVGGG